MMTSEATVILATERHLLLANVPNRGKRLLEVLNDHTTEFVTVNDARLFKQESEPPRGELETAIVRKANLVLAILPEQHEAPEKRHYSYVAKQMYSCLAVAGGYEIRGDLLLKGTREPIPALNVELPDFFPITKATVSHASNLMRPTESAVVLLNKAWVGLFQVGAPAGR